MLTESMDPDPDTHIWKCIAITNHKLWAHNKEDIHVKVKAIWSDGEDTWICLDALWIQDPYPLITNAVKNDWPGTLTGSGPLNFFRMMNTWLPCAQILLDSPKQEQKEEERRKKDAENIVWLYSVLHKLIHDLVWPFMYDYDYDCIHLIGYKPLHQHLFGPHELGVLMIQLIMKTSSQWEVKHINPMMKATEIILVWEVNSVDASLRELNLGIFFLNQFQYLEPKP